MRTTFKRPYLQALLTFYCGYLPRVIDNPYAEDHDTVEDQQPEQDQLAVL